jgi:hypothetical protein
MHRYAQQQRGRSGVVRSVSGGAVGRSGGVRRSLKTSTGGEREALRGSRGF